MDTRTYDDAMYKVGVIGLGQIAWSIDSDPHRKSIWSHIGAYENSPHTSILAVSSRKEGVCKKVQEQFSIPNYYTDYREMLATENLDIVSICEKRGVVLAVNFVRRWDNLSNHVSDLLEQNAIGDGDGFSLHQFKEANAAGKAYESLVEVETSRPAGNERMVDAISDIVDCISSKGQPRSSGLSSLDTLRIIDGIRRSAADGNSKILTRAAA